MKFKEEESYSWVCSCFLKSHDPYQYMHVNSPIHFVVRQLLKAFVLHLTGILIENMRREGFELSVSPPKVM